MAEEVTIRPIAHIRTDFAEKFGIPRQSGLAETLGEIVFEPAYRSADAVRGLAEFSHIWVIWQFSAVPEDAAFSATVRPPRLGGNARVGVFASRSPFRPNRLALSCLELLEVRDCADGPVLIVRGADMLDGSPIYDIKPYLPYADCVPQARGGFSATADWPLLDVACSEELLAEIPEEKRAGLLQVLAQDPRPSYQDDPDRIYGLLYAGFDVHFRVQGSHLTVVKITAAP